MNAKKNTVRTNTSRSIHGALNLLEKKKGPGQCRGQSHNGKSPVTWGSFLCSLIRYSEGGDGGTVVVTVQTSEIPPMLSVTERDSVFA